MRSLLNIVWLFLALYLGINWAAGVAESPGGVAVLSIISVLGLWIIGGIVDFVLRLIAASWRGRKAQPYRPYVGAMTEAERDRVFKEMAARRNGTLPPAQATEIVAPPQESPRRRPSDMPLKWFNG